MLDPNGRLHDQQMKRELMKHIDPNYIRSLPNSDAYREGWELAFGKKAEPCTLVDCSECEDGRAIHGPACPFDPKPEPECGTRDCMGHSLDEYGLRLCKTPFPEPLKVPIVLQAPEGVEYAIAEKDFCDGCGREDDECVCGDDE